MPPRISAGSASRDLVLVRPQNFPDEWYAMWEGLISDMRRESQSLPMNTMMLLMVERIATLYVQLRRREDANEADFEELRGLNKLWLNMCNEFATQLHRNSQTPEQRFVATFKAALNGAIREAGPDARVRDLMPVLADALREYGL